MNVKVSIASPNAGCAPTAISIPFLPGEMTVGQALQEAASRLAASRTAGAKTDADGDKPIPALIPALQLTRVPSRVQPVTDEYIGQDWLKNNVVNYAGNETLRYHVVPALVTSDEEESSDDDDSDDEPKSINIDGCLLRAVGRWPGRSNPEKHRDVISSHLYEYHSQEGLWASAATKVTTVRVPVDDNDGSLLRIELADTGDEQFSRNKGEIRRRWSNSISSFLDLVRQPLPTSGLLVS